MYFDLISYVWLNTNLSAFIQKGKEGHWTGFTSGSTITDTFWGPNHPNTNDGNTDDCAVMVIDQNNFWWEDTNCYATEDDEKIVAPICQTARSFECPSGWSEFNGHCYLLIDNSPLDWQAAEDDCIQRGGHLASIHSQAEHDFPGATTTIFWYGATDIDTEVNIFWGGRNPVKY